MVEVSSTAIQKAYVTAYQKSLATSKAKQDEKAGAEGADFESPAAVAIVPPSICKAWPGVRLFLNTLLTPLAFFMPGRVALAKGVIAAMGVFMAAACADGDV